MITLINAMDWSEQSMNNNELYIELDDSMEVLKAIAKWDNEVYEIKPAVHVGMNVDSVLLIDWGHNNVDFRYFLKWEMEPYIWSDGLKNIYIHNIGKYETTIFFRELEKRISCEAGAITKISKDEYDG